MAVCRMDIVNSFVRFKTEQFVKFCFPRFIHLSVNEDIERQCWALAMNGIYDPTYCF